MTASRGGAVHCLLFDDRAIAVELEPGSSLDVHAHAAHAHSLAMSIMQIARVAREMSEGPGVRGEDPESLQKITGLLVGAEALSSLVAALASDIETALRRESSR